MGLRCLLGHDFNAPEIERERKEEGEEMVVTVREVKVCERCGETQIITENKEVTSIRPPTDDATNPDADAAIDADVGAVNTADASEHADIGDESEVDNTWPESGDHPAVGDAETADPSESSFGSEFDEPPSAEEDDGIILDDDGEEESPERQPGEWPDAGDVGPTDRMPTLEEVEGDIDGEDDSADDDTIVADATEPEPSPWPEQQGEDEGFAAEINDEGDEGDDGNEGDVDIDFGNKLAPELEDTEEGYDAEFIGNDEEPSNDTGASGGFARAETLSRADASTVPTEYYCPACEMTRPADESSMRAGDICPECKHGYITERER